MDHELSYAGCNEDGEVFMECTCGYSTGPCVYWTNAGVLLDNHLEAHQ